MNRRLNVHFLPDTVPHDGLDDATAVVIDVLRATTVIAHALDAGASRIVPCLEVDEARQIAASDAADNVLLGGERGGLPIDGFDLGNSPQDYTTERVGGRTIVLAKSIAL